MERVDRIATYDAAFDYLTRFYNRKAGRPKLNELDSHEIDLTREEEEGPVADTGMDQVKTGQDPTQPDPLDLAAGLPGEIADPCHRSS